MSARKLPEITDVTIEFAYEIADQLANQSIHENGSTKVISGEHPEYGPIHIVIPPLGDATLLPLVVQNFDL